jgi:hypothetical protein
MPKCLARFCYWMRGQFDGMAISGAVRSETHDRFGSNDIHQILDRARVARANLTEPGQSS